MGPIGLLLLFCAGGVRGETLIGQLELPRELQSGRRFSGYWRVENGSVPVKDEPVPVVVMLTGAAGNPPGAKTYSVKLDGFAPDKPVLIVAPGSVVEITNGDRVPHDLSIPGQESMMPLERLSAGNLRRQKFPSAGIFEIRSASYPSTVVTVVVADHPHVVVADASGAFKLADVQKGKATLKVWTRGRFVHEEAVDVSGARNLRVVVAPQGGAAGE